MTAPMTDSAAMATPARRAFSAASAFMLGFLALVLFIYVCKVAKEIMIPFVIAFFLWYLINAVARVLGVPRIWRGRPMPRGVRTFLSVVMLSILIFVVGSLVRDNIDQVVHEAPKFQASFEKMLADGAARLGIENVPSFAELVELAKKHMDIGEVMSGFASLLTNLASRTFVIVVFIGLLLYEQRFFAYKMRRMVRGRTAAAQWHKVFRVIDVKIQRYVGVKAFVSALDSFLTFLILSMFRVDFAMFWGIMAFFLHFIPYAGSFVAISMPVIIALIQFGDLGTTLMVLAALCTSHAFLGHILDPYLMGNNLNLSPIFIISNLAMWGMIWGVPGMFLAIPILALASITLSQFKTTRPLAVMLSKTGELEKKHKPAAG